MMTSFEVTGLPSDQVAAGFERNGLANDTAIVEIRSATNGMLCIGARFEDGGIDFA